MKCETCRFNGNTEYDKPCIIRREDCELYEEVEDLTPNEAIERLEQMIKWGDTYEVDEDACKLAIKALKRYGVLQEIRQEIENNMESIIGKYDANTPEYNRPSHKIERNNGRKECLAIIDKRIKELEG